MIPPRLYIEPPQTEEETSAWTTADEASQAAAFRNERRRREFLTWRAIVRRELGRDTRIAYDELGAPSLPDGEAYVAVSHCSGRVAVCLSPNRCAVDIERADRDFSRAAERFLTPDEAALSSDPRWPGLVWCAKETLYKYARRRNLDLLRDLRIVSVRPSSDPSPCTWTIGGQIGNEAPLRLSACYDGDFLVVYIL